MGLCFLLCSLWNHLFLFCLFHLSETEKVCFRYHLLLLRVILLSVCIEMPLQTRGWMYLHMPPPRLSICRYISSACRITKYIPFIYGAEYWWTFMRADAEGLDQIRRLCEVGKLKIPVDKTFPITQVREAHEAKDKRHIPGKVVLEVDWKIYREILELSQTGSPQLERRNFNLPFFYFVRDWRLHMLVLPLQ